MAGFPASSLDFEPCWQSPLLICHHQLLQSLLKLGPYPTAKCTSFLPGLPFHDCSRLFSAPSLCRWWTRDCTNLNNFLIEQGRILEPVLPTNGSVVIFAARVSFRKGVGCGSRACCAWSPRLCLSHKLTGHEWYCVCSLAAIGRCRQEDQKSTVILDYLGGLKWARAT